MYNSLWLTIICAASGVLSSSISLPCNLDDTSCLEKVANNLRSILFAESLEHDIKCSDPVFIKKIVGEFPGYKYNLYNSSLFGYSNCVLSNFKINEDITKLQCDLNCPKLRMIGQYDKTGQIFGMSVEGQGDYSYITGKYFIHIEAELKKFNMNDGKTHVAIKDFKLKIKPQEPIQYHYTNLFNGQKDLADAFIKFKHENWRTIVEAVQDPIFYASLKNVSENINKHLEIIALEDLTAN